MTYLHAKQTKITWFFPELLMIKEDRNLRGETGRTQKKR